MSGPAQYDGTSLSGQIALVTGASRAPVVGALISLAVLNRALGVARIAMSADGLL